MTMRHAMWCLAAGATAGLPLGLLLGWLWWLFGTEDPMAVF